MAAVQKLLQQAKVVVADSSLSAAMHPLRPRYAHLAPLQAIEKRDELLAAGARLFLTNTADAARPQLRHLDLERATGAINARAARRMKALLADVSDETAVAGVLSVLPHYISHAEQINYIAEQVEALAQGGVDLLWAESYSSLNEIEALLSGCALAAPHLEIILTLGFRPNSANPFQLTPTLAAQRLVGEPHIIAIGVDTAGGDWRLEQSLAALKSVADEHLLAVKADADTLVVNAYTATNAVRQLTQMARTVAQLGARFFALDRMATVEQLRAVNETLNAQPAKRLSVP